MFTTVAAHSRKAVPCFSGSYHPKEPIALKNFNACTRALIGKQESRDMDLLKFHEHAQRVNTMF